MTAARMSTTADDISPIVVAEDVVIGVSAVVVAFEVDGDGVAAAVSLDNASDDVVKEPVIEPSAGLVPVTGPDVIVVASFREECVTEDVDESDSIDCTVDEDI